MKKDSNIFSKQPLCVAAWAGTLAITTEDTENPLKTMLKIGGPEVKLFMKSS